MTHMAKSVIEICNNALLDLGEAPIMSLDDGSKGAELCSRRWPAVRDAVLRAHPWNCAMAQAELAAGADAPLWRWDYLYSLPSDVVRVVRVVSTDGADVTEWEIQGSLILCNEQAPLFISYVKRETDPANFDPLLTEVMSSRLTAMLAYPLSASTALADSCWRSYREKLSEARGVDAREGVPEAGMPMNWLGAKVG